jgi:hypothetical protein
LYKNKRRFFFWIRVQHTLLLWAHLHVNAHALLSVKHHAHRITIRIPSPLRQWPKFKLTRRDVVPSLAQCNDEFYTIIKYLHKAASIMFEVTSQSQVCNMKLCTLLHLFGCRHSGISAAETSLLAFVCSRLRSFSQLC